MVIAKNTQFRFVDIMDCNRQFFILKPLSSLILMTRENVHSLRLVVNFSEVTEKQL